LLRKCTRIFFKTNRKKKKKEREEEGKGKKKKKTHSLGNTSKIEIYMSTLRDKEYS
jgi:hypothetical protein